MATMQRPEPDGAPDLEGLAAYLSDVANEQSELGRLDCVRFVVEALRAARIADVRPLMRYDDRDTALERIRRARGLDKAIRSELGEPNVGAGEFELGDMAFVPPHCIGFVMTDYIAVKSRATIWRIDLDCATHGWRLT